MNRLDRDRQTQILTALVEGVSMRSASRMAGVSINTVTKLLVDAGRACAEYQDEVLRDLDCKRVQCDEIWSFCYAKERNVPKKMRGKFGYGNVWTWTAICADSKLVLSWLVAERNVTAATAFMKDVASRLKNRVQLTTDGHKPYLQAVEDAFGSEVDFSMLSKIYGNDPTPQEVRYSPAVVLAALAVTIQGRPDPEHVSTSFAERQNLTMRMGMRRFTRLTNAFSKKVQNLEAAVSLHFMHYNFVRMHKTLRATPAMAAGVTNKLWELADVLDLVNQKLYSE